MAYARAFGISTLWLLTPVSPEVIGFDYGTLAALGALLPNLDASQSKIKHLKLLGMQFKPFLLPAQVVRRTDQHRGILHSLWGLAFITIITVPLVFCVDWAPILSLLTGFTSHVAADAMTRNGIRPLSSSHGILFVTKGLQNNDGGIHRAFLAAFFNFLCCNALVATFVFQHYIIA